MSVKEGMWSIFLLLRSVPSFVYLTISIESERGTFRHALVFEISCSQIRYESPVLIMISPAHKAFPLQPVVLVLWSSHTAPELMRKKKSEEIGFANAIDVLVSVWQAQR